MRTSDLLAYNAIVLLAATYAYGFKLIQTSKGKRFLPAEELIEDDDAQEGSSSSNERVFFHDAVPAGVVKVKAGSSITLDCEAGGTPTPTIHWLFEGGRIPQGNRHNVFDDEAIYEMSLSGDKVSSTLRLGNTKSRLYIDCVTPTHAGTYTCVAETPTKRVITTGVLEVDMTYGEDKCMKKRSKTAGSVPARVFMWTSQRLEYEGNDAQLFCRAEGSPAPSLAWYSPDDHLITAKDDGYVLLENGDLVVKGVSWQHMGIYRCVVENELGKDEASVFIYPTTEE